MRLRIRRMVVAAFIAVVVSSCSKKEPVVNEPDPGGDILIQGNLVTWKTADEVRGFVVYGVDASMLDHVAYPVAGGNKDKLFLTSHAVPLLDLEDGGLFYFRLGVEDRLGNRAYTEVESFTSTVGATGNLLRSTMVHIGWGDAHVLQMPTSGVNVLMDSGERDASVSVQSYLAAKGITTIHYMLASHIHLDHLGGIVGDFGSENTDGLLGSHTPQAFYDSPEKTHGRQAYDELLEELQALGVPRLVIDTFDTSDTVDELQWDDAVDVTVLSSGTPDGYNATGNTGQDINNDSIVLKITYGDVDFVIGGDAEFASESGILSNFSTDALEVEYYKGHHHGLDDASGGGWVTTLNPRISLIPVTASAWSGGGFDDRTDPLKAKLDGIGAHAYYIDDVDVLGIERGSGRQYNVTFVTDGISYEVRVERALQAVPKISAHALECQTEAPGSQEEPGPREGPDEE